VIRTQETLEGMIGTNIPLRWQYHQ
jgi:hypothetical protein